MINEQKKTISIFGNWLNIFMTAKEYPYFLSLWSPVSVISFGVNFIIPDITPYFGQMLFNPMCVLYRVRVVYR